MVKTQGFLIVVYLFAFLRTEFLLTVCRPVNTATHLALTLTIIVISFFCNSVSFYFVLSCLVAALLCAENLSVAFRGKFLPTMRTYFLFYDFTTLLSDFLGFYVLLGRLFLAYAVLPIAPSLSVLPVPLFRQVLLPYKAISTCPT